MFLDFSKAFDTVNHAILLQKLEQYGIRGLPLKWFDSYLSNRKQYVSIQNSKSSEQTIICGVPQGSLFGPLLFLIYINDISNSSEKLSFRLFADDTNIFASSKTLKDLENTVNQELALVKRWCDVNKAVRTLLVYISVTFCFRKMKTFMLPDVTNCLNAAQSCPLLPKGCPNPV